MISTRGKTLGEQQIHRYHRSDSARYERGSIDPSGVKVANDRSRSWRRKEMCETRGSIFATRANRRTFPSIRERDTHNRVHCVLQYHFPYLPFFMRPSDCFVSRLSPPFFRLYRHRGLACYERRESQEDTSVRVSAPTIFF